MKDGTQFSKRLLKSNKSGLCLNNMKYKNVLFHSCLQGYRMIQDQSTNAENSVARVTGQEEHVVETMRSNDTISVKYSGRVLWPRCLRMSPNECFTLGLTNMAMLSVEYC